MLKLQSLPPNTSFIEAVHCIHEKDHSKLDPKVTYNFPYLSVTNFSPPNTWEFTKYVQICFRSALLVLLGSKFVYLGQLNQNEA